MIAARILAFALVLVWAPAAVAQQAAPADTAPEGAFLSVVEDVPLMPGLVEDEASAVVFDAAQGRLAETVAVSASGRAAILAFYAETLPALGWLADGEARWVRAGEALALEFEDVSADGGPAGQGPADKSAKRKNAGDIAVRFSLSPANPR